MQEPDLPVEVILGLGACIVLVFAFAYVLDVLEEKYWK